jgi:hypothetical protein
VEVSLVPDHLWEGLGDVKAEVQRWQVELQLLKDKVGGGGQGGHWHTRRGEQDDAAQHST